MAPRTLVLEAVAPARTLDPTDVLDRRDPPPGSGQVDPQRPPTPPTAGQRRLRWLGRTALVVAAALAWGLLGLVAMIPALRRARSRKARACRKCRRNHRVWAAVSTSLAVLTLVGAGVRLAQDAVTIPRCPVTSVSTGASYENVPAPADGSLPAPVHAVLDAPAGGLATAVGHWQGRTMCDVRHPSLTLTFIPASRSTAGSTIGDVFVTPPRPGLDDKQTSALARHEARHSDQWAVATAIGGIPLLPAAYLLDQSLYPDELNHFEQAAGLAGGGYRPAPAQQPPPRPLPLVGWLLVAGLVLRRRLWHIARSIAGRPVTPSGHLCAMHTSGW